MHIIAIRFCIKILEGRWSLMDHNVRNARAVTWRGGKAAERFTGGFFRHTPAP
jgi:hypothetical protein